MGCFVCGRPTTEDEVAKNVEEHTEYVRENKSKATKSQLVKSKPTESNIVKPKETKYKQLKEKKTTSRQPCPSHIYVDEDQN
jgi:hypothetical protein